MAICQGHPLSAFNGHPSGKTFHSVSHSFKNVDGAPTVWGTVGAGRHSRDTNDQGSRPCGISVLLQKHACLDRTQNRA